MNTETYQMLPPDVVAGFQPGQVVIDESIPTGTVRIDGEGTARTLPVSAFVRSRRRARKTERQNRKRGRQ